MNRKTKEVLVGICIALVYIMVFRLLGAAAGLVFKGTEEDPNSNIYMSQLIGEVLGIILGTIATVIFHKTWIFREKGKGILAAFAAGGYLAVSVIVTFVTYIATEFEPSKVRPVSHIITYAVCMVLVGAAEEILFRGVIQNKLMDAFGRDTHKGVVTAVIVSGLIFALIHITNVFTGVTLTGAVLQALSVIGTGAVFGAVYARCNNIWAMILLHGAVDFAALAATGLQYDSGDLTSTLSETSPISLIGSAIAVGIALFIIRPQKMNYTAESEAAEK